MRHCGAANEAKVEPQVGDAREAPRCEQPSGRARRDARASSPEPAPPSRRAAPDMSWRGRRHRRARGGRRGRPSDRAACRGARSRPRVPAEVVPWRGRHQRRRRRRRRGERPWSAAAPTPRPHSVAAGAAAPAARAPSPCRGRRWWPGRALGAPPRRARSTWTRWGATRCGWRVRGARRAPMRGTGGSSEAGRPVRRPPTRPPPPRPPACTLAVPVLRYVLHVCAYDVSARGGGGGARNRWRAGADGDPLPASPAARAPRARRAAAAVKSQGA